MEGPKRGPGQGHLHTLPAVTEIFVDATGRRRRRMRRIAYAVGATCLIYTGLVGTSVVGRSAGPVALEPFPAPSDRPPVRPAPAPRRPAAAAAPEQDIRRGAPLRVTRTTSAPERATVGPAPVAVATHRPDPRLESTPTPAPTRTPPVPTPAPTSPSTPPPRTSPPASSPTQAPPSLEPPQLPITTQAPEPTP
jgi:hypothetical protein